MNKTKMLSSEEIENKKWALEALETGMKFNGKIKSIQPYGVFVTIKKGVDGLLPLRNISVSRIKDPSDIFKKGENIDVLIESFDKETGRIVFSHKEFLGTWEENVKNFKEGQTVIGKVKDKTVGGIFIELTPNLVGLAEHKSGLQYGDKVNVYIKKISPENHKIKLVILD